MLEAKTSKRTQTAVARQAKVAKFTARKADTRGAVEDVMIAAINRDLPAALFFVASADDKAFEEIRRRSVLLSLGRDDLADVARSLGITLSAEKIKGATLTLVNAVVLSRRLRC